jgi:3'-phosphoadenosine 5'-phosphosulfate sulfotransferase (PAPS reductase)/FAD synthetase
MDEKRDYHVVSFSGGKDSTAMLLHMLELNMPVDEVVFCDTTVEFPEMYNHIDKVKQYLDSVGYIGKFTVLRNKHGFEYYLLHHKRKRGKNKDKVGYSFPSNRMRWCTAALKREMVRKHFQKLTKQYNVIQYIGIAADEPKRVKDKAYPLVNWGWTEADCLAYCKSKGFNWGGLYDIFTRLSCWCCPLSQMDELRKLRKHFPELWKRLLDWQSQTWDWFKPNWTVDKLEIRFAYEDELGSTPRDRAFFNEVNRRYGLYINEHGRKRTPPAPC